MKRFLIFVFILALVFALSINAFAEVINEEVDVQASEDDPNNEAANVPYSPSSESSGEIKGELVDETVTVYSVTASGSNGLKSVVLGLIGDYETVVTDYEYRTGSNSYVSHSIDIQPDYAWLASMFLFTLVIYCLFRVGGALIG